MATLPDNKRSEKSMENKKLKQSSLCFLMLIISYTASAQVQNIPPMRQVLGTTGGTHTFTSGPIGSIDYTVGEVMVTTDSTASPFSSVKWLTQGFQQPEDNALRVEAVGVNSTCIGGNNGSANLSVINNSGTVTYSFNNSVFSTLSLFENLGPGTYDYIIKDGGATISGSVVITEDQAACDDKLKPYNGITPNGDGKNDYWQIDGITNFSSNDVSIYNRWGDLVWKTNNYNNTDEGKVWRGTNVSGNNLPDATYFYLIEATDILGKKAFRKGWVELTH